MRIRNSKWIMLFGLLPKLGLKPKAWIWFKNKWTKTWLSLNPVL